LKESQMETKNFGKNLLVYEDWYKQGGELEEEKLELFIKVTDYKRDIGLKHL